MTNIKLNDDYKIVFNFEGRDYILPSTKCITDIKFKGKIYSSIDLIPTALQMEFIKFCSNNEKEKIQSLAKQFEVEEENIETNKKYLIEILEKADNLEVLDIRFVNNIEIQFNGVDVIALVRRNYGNNRNTYFICYDLKTTSSYINRNNLVFELYQNCQNREWHLGSALKIGVCKNHFLAYIDTHRTEDKKLEFFNCFLVRKSIPNTTVLKKGIDKVNKIVRDNNSKDLNVNNKFLLVAGEAKNTDLFKELDYKHYINHVKYVNQKTKEQTLEIFKIHDSYSNVFSNFKEIAKDIENLCELLELDNIKFNIKGIIRFKAYDHVSKYMSYYYDNYYYSEYKKIHEKETPLYIPDIDELASIFYKKLLYIEDFKYKSVIEELLETNS